MISGRDDVLEQQLGLGVAQDRRAAASLCAAAGLAAAIDEHQRQHQQAREAGERRVHRRAAYHFRRLNAAMKSRPTLAPA